MLLVEITLLLFASSFKNIAANETLSENNNNRSASSDLSIPVDCDRPPLRIDICCIIPPFDVSKVENIMSSCDLPGDILENFFDGRRMFLRPPRRHFGGPDCNETESANGKPFMKEDKEKDVKGSEGGKDKDEKRFPLPLDIPPSKDLPPESFVNKTIIMSMEFRGKPPMIFPMMWINDFFKNENASFNRADKFYLMALSKISCKLQCFFNNSGLIENNKFSVSKAKNVFLSALANNTNSSSEWTTVLSDALTTCAKITEKLDGFFTKVMNYTSANNVEFCHPLAGYIYQCVRTQMNLHCPKESVRNLTNPDICEGRKRHYMQCPAPFLPANVTN